jgi:hypothetical protein
MKTSFVYILLFLFSISGSIAQAQSISITPVKTIHIADTSYAVLPGDSSMNWLFHKAKSSTLSKAEVATVNELLISCMTEHKLEIMNPELYHFQYMAMINEHGEKEVWVNAFCELFFQIDWKKNIVMVDDGGNCYFNFRINLKTGKYAHFGVNGEA